MKKNFKNAKTIQEFMDATGIRSEETLVKYIIQSHQEFMWWKKYTDSILAEAPRKK